MTLSWTLTFHSAKNEGKRGRLGPHKRKKNEWHKKPSGGRGKKCGQAPIVKVKKRYPPILYLREGGRPQN